jgi:hypothetical protein
MGEARAAESLFIHGLRQHRDSLLPGVQAHPSINSSVHSWRIMVQAITTRPSSIETCQGNAWIRRAVPFLAQMFGMRRAKGEIKTVTQRASYATVLPQSH